VLSYTLIAVAGFAYVMAPPSQVLIVSSAAAGMSLVLSSVLAGSPDDRERVLARIAVGGAVVVLLVNALQTLYGHAPFISR
jgi:hypothetical protein